MFIIKSSRLWENIKDSILNWIEKISGRIYNWTWDKRWKNRDLIWIKEYREWKKTNGR